MIPALLVIFSLPCLTVSAWCAFVLATQPRNH